MRSVEKGFNKLSLAATVCLLIILLAINYIHEKTVKGIGTFLNPKKERKNYGPI